MTTSYYAQNLAHLEKEQKQLKFVGRGEKERAIIIDGPVSPTYDEETCKLLWVLKEPHAKDGGWSLIDFLRDNPDKKYPKWAATFGLVVKVSKLLLHPGSQINEVATTPSHDLIDYLKRIAVINLNKFGGGARQGVNYADGVKACRELVRWQLDNLDPNIIICGGGSTFAGLSEIVGLKPPAGEEIWPYRERFPSFIDNRGRIFISAYHTGQSIISAPKYCERVLDALESGIECG